jgi:F-type H+-transporting ATPase subunit a
MLAMYLPVAMMAGLLGLPSPTTYWGVPLILAFITFLGIHGTAIKFQGVKGWSHRFIEPVAVFLPINIMTLPSTIISLSFRMFGNALAGSIIMTVCYWGCSMLSEALIAIPFLGDPFNFSAVFITPVLHAYFDVFSGYIQSLVFIYLSCQFVAQEIPEDDELELQNI